LPSPAAQQQGTTASEASGRHPSGRPKGGTLRGLRRRRRSHHPSTGAGVPGYPVPVDVIILSIHFNRTPSGRPQGGPLRPRSKQQGASSQLPIYQYICRACPGPIFIPLSPIRYPAPRAPRSLRLALPATSTNSCSKLFPLDTPKPRHNSTSICHHLPRHHRRAERRTTFIRLTIHSTPQSLAQYPPSIQPNPITSPPSSSACSQHAHSTIPHPERSEGYRSALAGHRPPRHAGFAAVPRQWPTTPSSLHTFARVRFANAMHRRRAQPQRPQHTVHRA